MKYKQKNKDLENRIFFKKTEIIKKILTFLLLYCKSKILKKILKKNYDYNNYYKKKIKNFCVISGRSRGILRKFKISRIFFRILGSKGFFFGLKKSSW